MHPDQIRGLGGPQSLSDTTDKALRPEAQADFRRLLESLEELQGAGTAEESSLGKARDFFDAMQQADDEFQSVMDLRRQLEQAYRSHQE